MWSGWSIGQDGHWSFGQLGHGAAIGHLVMVIGHLVIGSHPPIGNDRGQNDRYRRDEKN